LLNFDARELDKPLEIKEQGGEIIIQEKQTGPVYEAIDLGLSVKWANMNVGATQPWEYGDYFAWGETEPYYLNWTDRTQAPTQWKNDKGYAPTPDGNYKWVNNDSEEVPGIMQPYNSDTLLLNSTNDAATVNMGSQWRMPSGDQIYELINYFFDGSSFIREHGEWVINYQNSGVNGVLVYGTGSGQGNTMFLPAAGFLNGKYLKELGINANYWSNERSGVPYCAQVILLLKEEPQADSDFRYLGSSIRGVLIE